MQHVDHPRHSNVSPDGDKVLGTSGVLRVGDDVDGRDKSGLVFARRYRELGSPQYGVERRSYNAMSIVPNLTMPRVSLTCVLYPVFNVIYAPLLQP
jgi:hypothetical protein